MSEAIKVFCWECHGSGLSNHGDRTQCTEDPCWVTHWNEELDMPFVGSCMACDGKGWRQSNESAHLVLS